MALGTLAVQWRRKMSEALGIFVIVAVLALWEIERIRKDTTRMRIMMETQHSKLHDACNNIALISGVLEQEIMDARERRLRRDAIN
jgi:hypothetical protein